MSVLGHSRPSHFVPVLNNVRYASDSDHSRYESELTLWAKADIGEESASSNIGCGMVRAERVAELIAFDAL
jgi:hypothetical protein